MNTIDYGQDGGWRGVSVNLAAGSAEDSWGDSDTIANVSNVIGTNLNDWIAGSAGDNVITGGAGNDTLTGNGGNDIFTFSAGHGSDRINDLGAGDTLVLEGLGFTSVEQVVAAAVGDDLGV